MLDKNKTVKIVQTDIVCINNFIFAGIINRF